MGIHETQQRSQIDRLKLTLADLWNGSGIEGRLVEIGSKWASFRIGKEIVSDEAIEVFVKCAQRFAELVYPMGIVDAKDPIFEGSQGLLLSQDNTEYAPHLTHSYTGMHNVRILCDQAGWKPEIYYVTRSYLTRHGSGRLPGEDSTLWFNDDTNFDNRWQGPLRFAPLDSGLRGRIAKDAGGEKHRLLMTHCDQSPPGEADIYSYGPSRKDVSAVKG